MPDPNNLYIPEHDVCFQLICKAGNTSVKWCLIDSLIGMDMDKQAIAKDPALAWGFLPKEEIPRSALKIGFVRDPYDRLVSCYMDKICRNFHQGFIRRHPGVFHPDMTFPDFVDAVSGIPDWDGCDQHFRSFSYDLLPADELDVIVRMESFMDDWAAVHDMCMDRGLVLKPIGHKNQSSGTYMCNSLDMEKVFKRYDRDYDYLETIL